MKVGHESREAPYTQHFKPEPLSRVDRAWAWVQRSGPYIRLSVMGLFYLYPPVNYKWMLEEAYEANKGMRIDF